MSSYPILDNRPIDQWRVVELREELKRRKLTTRGLKEDLVKRLDEALRIEREIAEEEKEKQADYGTAADHMHKVTDKGKVVAPIASESAPILDNVCIANEKVDDAQVEDDVNYNFGTLDAILAGEVGESAHTESVAGLSPEVASVETISIVSVSCEHLAMPSEHGAEIFEAQGSCNSEIQPDKEDVEAVHKDVILESSTPVTQVSEANPDLGLQVRSDYISTDSVSINEKNEYKDNIIADNIKLELDILKPELGVEPSSSSVDPASGESHPLDVVEPHEDKIAAESKEENDAVTADINKNNENVDTGDSEKLNLDRSSGYESMEEDVMDSKHFDSKPIGGGVKEESAQVEESLVDIVGDADVKDIDVHKDHASVLIEKRKLYGNATDGPAKRQRKWKADGLQVAEPKVVSVATTTPKDIPQASSMKRKLSSMSDSVSDGSPKERLIPPSQKPASDSLRIDQFLRPFTLKAVQELLGKTGSITRFWMDHIKTHCYVTYSSVEETVETRNAIYNLQWPPNGGRLLVAEFVDPHEVKARIDGPPAATPALTPAPLAPKPIIPVSLSPTSAVKAVSQPHQPVPRQLQQHQQRPPPPSLLHSPLLPPPPSLIVEKADPTIVTLDVLFKKTKATPRIYYLPLSEEQVAAKLALGGRTVRQ